MLDDVAMVMMVHLAPAATCVRTGVDAESTRRSMPAAGGVR